MKQSSKNQDSFTEALEESEFRKGLKDALLDKVALQDKFLMNSILDDYRNSLLVPNYSKNMFLNFFQSEDTKTLSKEYILRNDREKIYAKLSDKEFKAIKTTWN